MVNKSDVVGEMMRRELEVWQKIADMIERQNQMIKQQNEILERLAKAKEKQNELLEAQVQIAEDTFVQDSEGDLGIGLGEHAP